jgi:hypothetical protein
VMRRRPTVALDDRRKAQLTRVMEVAILAVLVVGAWRGEASVVVNAGFALGVTFVPSALERDLRVPMNPGLTLWVTTAVFLHAIGAVEVWGVTAYSDLWFWDHLTHAASGSLIAGAGYAVVRGVDEHTDDVQLTPAFTFGFTLLFILAIGVYWELFEFALAHVSVGGESPLTQYGVEDTMKDLVFNTVGGVLAATYGAAHLSPLVDEFRAKLESRFGKQ